ncbi:Txe/YoeB family addiction module toxin [Helicobacter monodelphidis]|uniref:Txe/YoeB family addiction module toxin n=1 Tax=Helicobacter sp. 15-1451 TaxID=2004995 RepID=UPI000DCC0EB1|nr:Txe/YoeB family addiction module toxin [Helicobacter sp. 15-1451]RAX57256.1 Txe/YoeB family addiction module toxin [Helicobacter sp. 15-1451]
MRKITFAESSWNQYTGFINDKKIFAKINALIKEIARDPMKGTGKPESLRGDLSGCYSRRIDSKHRNDECFKDKLCTIS